MDIATCRRVVCVIAAEFGWVLSRTIEGGMSLYGTKRYLQSTCSLMQNSYKVGIIDRMGRCALRIPGTKGLQVVQFGLVSASRGTFCLV
jgi:hypothetical protein